MMAAASDIITPINALISIVAAVGGGALGLVAWLRHERRGISEEIRSSAEDRDGRLDGIDDEIRDLGERTARVEAGMAHVEARLDQLPTAGQLHEVQLSLTDLSGRIVGLGDILTRVERTMERHDKAFERIYDLVDRSKGSGR